MHGGGTRLVVSVEDALWLLRRHRDQPLEGFELGADHLRLLVTVVPMVCRGVVEASVTEPLR